MLLEPAQITFRVTSVLEKLNVRYLVVGSLASALYGVVRTTQDSDVVTELGSENVDGFVHALEEEFYIDPEMISEAIARNSSFNIIHRDSFFKVDIFIPEPRPFVESQLLRAKKQAVSVDPPAEVFVATPEDTLLAKLEWYRMGGEISERQWRDVLGILEVQGEKINLDYLQGWAEELKVSDLLERAIKEAGWSR